jgi:hypothetical protein
MGYVKPGRELADALSLIANTYLPRLAARGYQVASNRPNPVGATAIPPLKVHDG